MFKFSPELLLAYDRIAVEGQYYYMNVARRGDLANYRAQGGYGMLRGILIGEAYGYSHGDAGIFGGRSNDFSLTFNYYINKYMMARLRYSYTNVSNSELLDYHKCHVNTIQARIQILF